MIPSILALGFVVGLRHAFEADHLAAVSTLATRRADDRRSTLGDLSRLGAAWGLGHTLTLFLVSAVVFLSGVSLPVSFERFFEAAVGIMLVGLGAQLLYRLWRDRIHVHVHEHDDGVVHLHAHSHRGEEETHAESEHAHGHDRGLAWRTLGVGLVHGLAGSAALTLYVASTLESPLWGLVYVAVFGVGSMAGMALLSMVIALPLTWTARSLTWAHRGLQGVIGAATVVVGAVLLVAQA